MTRDRQVRCGVGQGGRVLFYALACAGLSLCSAPGWAQAGAPGASAPPSTLPAGNLSQKPEAQPGTPQPSAQRSAPVSDDSAAATVVERQTQQTVQHPGVLIDRVVAVVNGEVILESDVDEERRMTAFQPVTHPDETFDREKGIERLIDRRLLLQQAVLQPHKETTDEEINTEVTALRHEIPACKEAKCDTDAGWKKFLAEQGIEEGELKSYLRDRAEALAFIELRFRSGARISNTEIKDYYEKTMLPEYGRRHVKPPSLEVLSDRIQEVLLQQRVSGLLSDWLKSLRAQGTVEIVADGASAS